MRVALLVVLALFVLAAPVDAHGGPAGHLIHRNGGGHSAWWVERLTAPGDTITVDLETVGNGEVIAHTIILLDAQERALPGSGTIIYPGGNRGDLAIGASAARVSTDEGGVALPLVFNGGARDIFTFSCKVASGCNPSRQFTLIVASSSDNMTANGFAVNAPGGMSGANATGTKSFVRTARMFDGTVLHASAETPGGGKLGGISVIQDARTNAHVDDRLFAAFFKAGGSAPSMSVQTPTTTRPCPCAILGDAAGDYVFRLGETDTSGREAALWWADIRIP